MLLGWIDVTWDHGGSNSYRMGAEGKYDLKLAEPSEPSKPTSPSMYIIFVLKVKFFRNLFFYAV